MRVLVTGGAGFIGSHVVDALLSAGDQVMVVDDLSSGDFGWIDDRILVRADILSTAARKAILSFRPHSVVMLAAQASVKASMQDPLFDAQVNVMGLIRTVTTAIEAGAESVVFASSGGTIYGDVPIQDQPIRESMRRRPLSFYGVSKSVGIDYLTVFAREHGLRHVELALGNVYGPRQNPSGEAGVIAIFAGQLIRGETCTIYGDGKVTRDFVHCSDVARAFATATRRGHGLMNIGSGRATSVIEVFDLLAAEIGASREHLAFSAQLGGEVQHVALDSGAALAQLGWKAETDLRTGIADTVEWMRANQSVVGNGLSDVLRSRGSL